MIKMYWLIDWLSERVIEAYVRGYRSFTWWTRITPTSQEPEDDGIIPSTSQTESPGRVVWGFPAHK